MLRAIEFKDKRFMTKKDNNLFSPITENTIILCNNYKLMDSLAKEIIDASQVVGASVKKREDTHRMAEANKAFAHYKW